MIRSPFRGDSTKQQNEIMSDLAFLEDHGYSANLKSAQRLPA
jgi:hypothetical protein